jgi:hypothetical protein
VTGVQTCALPILIQIVGLLDTVPAGTPLALSGTVEPDYATTQSINGSINTVTRGGADISDNSLTSVSPGAVTVMATIVNGLATGNYNQDFDITVTAGSGFVPVTNISGVPGTATVGTPLALSGTVEPANASNKTIAWTVKNTGGAGAFISGNSLTSSTTGTVTVTATIVNGLATGNYTKDFTIAVSSQEAADAAAFRSAHSVILAKTVGTIAIADETAVDNALGAYNSLSSAAKALLTTEKTLLDSLKAKIATLGTGSITLVYPTDAASRALSTTPITIAKTAGTYQTTHTLTVTGDFDSYRWRVDGSAKGNIQTLVLNAGDYTQGIHQISLEVTLNGAVYSKSGSFTVEP